jgi:nucleoside-diphosphate-sugar epimerase
MILITGASGFIGRNLSVYLHEKGVSVLASGRRDHDDYFNEKGIPYVQLDFSNSDHYVNLEGKDIKTIIHLAAIVPTKKKVHSTNEYISINGNGILLLLDYCVKHEIERFINTSSISVYGASGKKNVKEDVTLTPFGPYADYAIAKILSELFTDRYAIDHGLHTLSLRLGYVFGDYTKEHLLLPRLIKRALDGEELIIEGTGEFIFDVVYIEDCIKLFDLVLNTPSTGIFNVGSGEPVTLNQIVSAIDDYAYNTTKKRTLIRHVDSNDNKPGYIMSLEKSNKFLGYQPRFRGMEVVNKVLNDYDKNRKGNKK